MKKLGRLSIDLSTELTTPASSRQSILSHRSSNAGVMVMDLTGNDSPPRPDSSWKCPSCGTLNTEEYVMCSNTSTQCLTLNPNDEGSHIKANSAAHSSSTGPMPRGTILNSKSWLCPSCKKTLNNPSDVVCTSGCSINPHDPDCIDLTQNDVAKNLFLESSSQPLSQSRSFPTASKANLSQAKQVSSQPNPTPSSSMFGATPSPVIRSEISAEAGKVSSKPKTIPAIFAVQSVTKKMLSQTPATPKVVDWRLDCDRNTMLGRVKIEIAKDQPSVSSFISDKVETMMYIDASSKEEYFNEDTLPTRVRKFLNAIANPMNVNFGSLRDKDNKPVQASSSIQPRVAKKARISGDQVSAVFETLSASTPVVPNESSTPTVTAACTFNVVVTVKGKRFVLSPMASRSNVSAHDERTPMQVVIPYTTPLTGESSEKENLENGSNNSSSASSKKASVKASTSTVPQKRGRKPKIIEPPAELQDSSPCTATSALIFVREENCPHLLPAPTLSFLKAFITDDEYEYSEDFPVVPGRVSRSMSTLAIAASNYTAQVSLGDAVVHSLVAKMNSLFLKKSSEKVPSTVFLATCPQLTTIKFLTKAHWIPSCSIIVTFCRKYFEALLDAASSHCAVYLESLEMFSSAIETVPLSRSKELFRSTDGAQSPLTVLRRLMDVYIRVSNWIQTSNKYDVFACDSPALFLCCLSRLMDAFYTCNITEDAISKTKLSHKSGDKNENQWIKVDALLDATNKGKHQNYERSAWSSTIRQWEGRKLLHEVVRPDASQMCGRLPAVPDRLKSYHFADSIEGLSKGTFAQLVRNFEENKNDFKFDLSACKIRGQYYDGHRADFKTETEVAPTKSLLALCGFLEYLK